MLKSTLLTLAASLALASAQYKGFNYGSTFTNGAAKTQADFEAEFTTAQTLTGTSGFASARLFTTIQGGTANTPISAIPAAIRTKTSLLWGLWASAGQDVFSNELAALSAAIAQYGTAFTDLVVGISVGSEDLYRISPTGILNESGVGAQPDTLVSYIEQLRNAIKGTSAGSKPVGHVDTWNDWVNGSNSAVVAAVDFVGMDAYPYFESTKPNAIADSYVRFTDAYSATVAAAQGKPVWVTETGWPVSGPTSGAAVPSPAFAKIYWDTIGCGLLFGKVNTWWFTLQDAAPTTPAPSFGVVGSQLSTIALFDLTCPAGGASSSAGASAGASGTSSAAGSASSGAAGSAGSGSGSGSGGAAAQSSSAPSTVTGGGASAGGGTLVTTVVSGAGGSPSTVTSTRTGVVSAPTGAAGSGSGSGSATTRSVATQSVNLGAMNAAPGSWASWVFGVLQMVVLLV